MNTKQGTNKKSVSNETIIVGSSNVKTEFPLPKKEVSIVDNTLNVSPNPKGGVNLDSAYKNEVNSDSASKNEVEIKLTEEDKEALDKWITEVKAPFVVAKEEKKVKIRPAQDHKCIIGGEHYSFKKDKIELVPRHVKEILEKSPLGLLKPL